MQYNTMRLTEAPAEIGTSTRKAWDDLFQVYGFSTFHPIEGRGVLRATSTGTKRSVSWYDDVLQTFLDQGYAIAP